jgi:hypothetical protein
MDEQDLVYRLRKRAEIRRQISSRKSVQEGKPDRISDLLEEAAAEILRLKTVLNLNYSPYVLEDKFKSAQEWANSLTKEQAIAFVDKITGGWVDLEPELWQEIIATTKDVWPLESGHGTHCHNHVYQVGKNLYDLTYEHSSDTPIDIKFKRV